MNCPEVALAMLEREGRWLLQLRDDIDGIVYPGTWALFGGHLESGESPAQAVQRELKEEINWTTTQLEPWFSQSSPQRIAHFFRAALTVPLSALTLLEGQDMALASLEELCSGQVSSKVCGETRSFAPSLQWAVDQMLQENSR
ncbi:NUDIX hydrolase [Synechococcus sp. UW140]|uniref:NUDIX hydrolase n=1 Tax=Synechococcus sp. UW140 TaxID=368503 RepID=UPI0025E72A68|nr:NUDIX hydrolase [Synechococcus sp. UW140]